MRTILRYFFPRKGTSPGAEQRHPIVKGTSSSAVTSDAVVRCRVIVISSLVPPKCIDVLLKRWQGGEKEIVVGQVEEWESSQIQAHIPYQMCKYPSSPPCRASRGDQLLLYLHSVL